MNAESQLEPFPATIECVIFDMAGTTVDDLIDGVPLMIIAMIQVCWNLYIFSRLHLMDNFEGIQGRQPFDRRKTNS